MPLLTALPTWPALFAADLISSPFLSGLTLKYIHNDTVMSAFLTCRFKILMCSEWNPLKC